MKTNLLRMLTAVSALLGAVSAADIHGISAVLPPRYAAKFMLAALLSLAIKEVAVVIGDLIDNGKRDNSFKG